MFSEFSETETRLFRNKLDLRLHNFHVLCVHVHIQLKIRLIILGAFVSVNSVSYFGFIRVDYSDKWINGDANQVVHTVSLIM